MELLIVLGSLLSVSVSQVVSYLPSTYATPFYTQFQYGFGGVGLTNTVDNQGRREGITDLNDFSNVNFSRTFMNVNNEFSTQSLQSTDYIGQSQESATQTGSQNITLGELKISEIPFNQQVIILPSSPDTDGVQSMMVPASTTKLELNDFVNPFIATPACPLSPHDANILHPHPHPHHHPHPDPHPHPHLHLHPHPHPHPHPDPHLHLHAHPHHHHLHLDEFQHRIQTTDGNNYFPNPLQLNTAENVAVPSSSPKFFSTEQIIPLR